MTAETELRRTPQPISLEPTDGRPNLDFTGVVLGSVTSRWKTHTAHRGEYAPRGETCGACRWTEVTVYRRNLPSTPDPASAASPFFADHDYVVYRVGRSVVPGETQRRRWDESTSPFSVVEFLTVRPDNGDPYMPPQHARVLAEAAMLDHGLRDAYINRAVV